MSQKKNQLPPLSVDTELSTLQKPSMKSHVILWSAAACMFIFLIWAAFAKLDTVTRGTGKVIPSSQIQVIQNLEGGIIQKITVKEGDHVEKNQILMHIDDTQFLAQFRESRAKEASLEALVARLTAEANDTPLVFSTELTEQYPNIVANEKSFYQSRALATETRLETLKTKVKQLNFELEKLRAKKEKDAISYQLLLKELNMTRPLLKTGSVSAVELLQLERQVNDLKGELASSELSIPSLEQDLAEAKNKMKELLVTIKTDIWKELTAAKSDLASQVEKNTQSRDRFRRTLVRSPVKGTVNVISVKTIGGVVQPGMTLMEIVPLEDSLLVEANIKPSDVAFIHPGQKAMVKITAYDFSIYGGLEGVVEHISADTIQDKSENNDKSFYVIRVRTDKSYLIRNNKKLPIIPGMTATVDILTGEKTVLDFILKPILKTKQNALGER